jgi:mRNA interferase HicA
MKRRDLESRVRRLGWSLERSGGRHDIWTKPGRPHVLVIPRHAEINEHIARGILKEAAR